MKQDIVDQHPIQIEDVTLQESKKTRKIITIRKRIVRKIVVLPDGTRKEVEEEVPLEEEAPEHEVVHDEDFTQLHLPDTLEDDKKHPKPVERVHVTRVIRKADGTENLLDKSETIFPLDVTPVEETGESVEEEKDNTGLVIRRVVRRPVMLTSKRTVIRRNEI